MTTLAQVILRDIATNRPAAATAGRLFYDTTAGKWQRDTGADWEDCEPGSSAPDAAAVTYTPAVAADWDSDADPGDVDQALDQLAERVDDLEGAGYITGIDAAAVTYTPGTAADWDSDTDPGDVDQALDQLAERVDDLEGAGGSGDVTWAIIQASQLANEVMGWPADTAIDLDLDAKKRWWRKVGTPTTAPTMVDVAGESGITETWEYALKCVADASGEGLYQRYTYADQHRVKSGCKLSAIAAVWVGTAGRTVTMKLITSASTEVTSTATAQGWTVIKCENLTLDGTYADLQFTIDGADTFYVVPLGCNVGEKAVPLPPRGERHVTLLTHALVKTLTGIGNENTWTDIDCTTASSPLATRGNFAYRVDQYNSYSFVCYVRWSGSASLLTLSYTNSTFRKPQEAFIVIPFNDEQIFQYNLGSDGGTLSNGTIVLIDYWEWA